MPMIRRGCWWKPELKLDHNLQWLKWVPQYACWEQDSFKNTPEGKRRNSRHTINQRSWLKKWMRLLKRPLWPKTMREKKIISKLFWWMVMRMPSWFRSTRRPSTTPSRTTQSWPQPWMPMLTLEGGWANDFATVDFGQSEVTAKVLEKGKVVKREKERVVDVPYKIAYCLRGAGFAIN